MHDLGSPNIETSRGEHRKLNASRGCGWMAVTVEIYYSRMLW